MTSASDVMSSEVTMWDQEILFGDGWHVFYVDKAWATRSTNWAKWPFRFNKSDKLGPWVGFSFSFQCWWCFEYLYLYYDKYESFDVDKMDRWCCRRDGWEICSILMKDISSMRGIETGFQLLSNCFIFCSLVGTMGKQERDLPPPWDSKRSCSNTKALNWLCTRESRWRMSVSFAPCTQVWAPLVRRRQNQRLWCTTTTVVRCGRPGPDGKGVLR